MTQPCTPVRVDRLSKQRPPLEDKSAWRTLRFKVKRESYAWLNEAAVEVNQVFNACNQISFESVTRCNLTLRKSLTGSDLCDFAAGASRFFKHISEDTIQRICWEYANKRIARKRVKLRWRVSHGPRRSLGWVPFKACSLNRSKNALRFCGKTFRLFETQRLQGAKWANGSFAQDAVGDWWLCLPVQVQVPQKPATWDAVGIDLGLKAVAVTSDAGRLHAGAFYRDLEPKIAQAQCRGHKRQATRLHRKAARRRKDALHKFSRRIVNGYQNIVVGDIGSLDLTKTWKAKSALDSGWGQLRQYLQYKGEHAGRTVKIVNEQNTTRTCSGCGRLTGPTGPDMLVVRRWRCVHCGEWHERDVNAARNILRVASRCQTSVRGNDSMTPVYPPSLILFWLSGKPSSSR